MTKKKTPSATDLQAFYDAVKGTKLLSPDKIHLKSTKKVLRPSPLPTYDDHQDQILLLETADIAKVGSDEIISYKQVSVSHKTLRNLRKGQYNVDAMLDLHGHTIEEAKQAVEAFLQDCLNEKVRVGLIIHGKGHHSKTPILKNKLNRWLRNTVYVLAFCSATKSHGSSGAVYVLLKDLTQEKDA